jgi:hypothetical protein
MLVEDLVDEPPKKKARSKKVKRVTFDDVGFVV